MLTISLLVIAVVAVGLNLPWWISGILVLPGVLWAPGWSWAKVLVARSPGDSSTLQVGLDAAWIGLAIAWLDVAVVRELGLRADAASWGLLALSAAWAVAGAWKARGLSRSVSWPRREWVGIGAVVLALLALVAWRSGDLARPLDGHWYMEGADEEGHAPLVLEPGDGWSSWSTGGWPESRAAWGTPGSAHPRLVAPDGAKGRLVLAVRGAVGSRISVGDQENTVESFMTEDPDEGPVER
ncbi:MAG: hypothetical protein QGG40_21840, partial [Myxococcota bacterium]|nr:hypothetical protein [Myxococcota bacterium]